MINVAFVHNLPFYICIKLNHLNDKCCICSQPTFLYLYQIRKLWSFCFSSADLLVQTGMSSFIAQWNSFLVLSWMVSCSCQRCLISLLLTLVSGLRLLLPDVPFIENVRSSIIHLHSFHMIGVLSPLFSVA